MKGSRTRLRKVLPEREREEAAVPEAIERLISRGPPAGSGIPFEAWRSWHRYGSLPVRPRSFGIPVPTIAAGWARMSAPNDGARGLAPRRRALCRTHQSHDHADPQATVGLSPIRRMER